LGAGAINAFLTGLAVNGRIAASTRSQARYALLFLYQHVLGVDRDLISQRTSRVGLAVVLQQQ